VAFKFKVDDVVVIIYRRGTPRENTSLGYVQKITRTGE
jgi:hypothetical protein